MRSLTTTSSAARAVTFAALICVSGAVQPAFAQPRAERRPAAEAGPAPAVEREARAERGPRMDAEATRQSWMDLLQRHPPAVARVFKLDPSLMRNDDYLAAYPDVKDFLAEHPEIPQNAAYYLDTVRQFEYGPPRSPNRDLVEGMLAGLAGFAAFSIFLGTVIWLVRTALDQRRWSRLSKIQAEVHSKLMDRFSSNDELLTYVQTPSGRRFLESGPSPLQETAPTMAAPFARILWSVQVGAILLVSGVGLLFLSGRAVEEAREVFYVAGCLATALGAGFVVSAAAAYFLSRRLGLLDRPVQTNA